MTAIAFYVTAHGYGHATRQSALVAELARRKPGLRLLVRTGAPAWLFPREAECFAADVDAALVQRGALEVDLDGSLRRHEELGRGWDSAVEREAAWLRSQGARLAVCDVPPLGAAAAARAGIPAFVVGNFTWDWVLEDYAAQEPRWSAIAERYAHAYARAEALFRLPMHGEFSGFARVVDCPLLVRRSALSRPAARAAVGLGGDARPAVLMSFGGVGLRESPRSTDDLSDWVFVGWGRKPAGLRARWLELPPGRAGAHVDAMAACHVVLTKPGYGTFAEAAVHRTRVLYLPREGFIEIPALVRGLESLGLGQALPQADFRAGLWREPLEALLSRSYEKPAPDAGGAAFIADALLKAL